MTKMAMMWAVTRVIMGEQPLREAYRKRRKGALGISPVSMGSYKAGRALGQETGGHTSREQQGLREPAPSAQSSPGG